MSRDIPDARRTFLLVAGLLCGAATIGAEPLPVRPLVLKPVLYGHLPFWDVKSTTQSTVGGGSSGGLAPNSGDTVLGISAQGFVVRTGANIYTARSLVADTGVTISNADGVAGNATIGVDAAVVPFFSTGAADPSANCTVGTTIFTQTTDHTVWFCNNTNTWALQSLGNNYTQFAGPATSRKTFTLPNASATVLTDNAAVTAAQGGTGRATLTAHNVLLGNGTGTVGFAAPSTAGYVLTDNGASSDPTFQAPSASGASSATSLVLWEDFVNANITSGTVGETGMNVSPFSTGTMSATPGSTTNPGLVRLNSHATNDNSGESVYFGSSATNAAFNASVWANKDWSFDAVVIFGSNGTAITNTDLNVGLVAAANTAAAQAAGIYIRHDSDLSDTTFVFAVCNAASTGCDSAGDVTSQKVVASTITPVAGTAYRFRIRQAASGVGGVKTIYMRVNDETEKTFCSSGCDDTLGTLSTSTAYVPWVLYLTRTTTGVMSSDVDYMGVTIPGLARY